MTNWTKTTDKLEIIYDVNALIYTECKEETDEHILQCTGTTENMNE